MIQNVPSIYNQPSIYNGGGGAPGDFGTPGASILPVGYRQVAAVYVPEPSDLSAQKYFKLSDYNLPDFDTNGMTVKVGTYCPNPRGQYFGSSIDLFRLKNSTTSSYIAYAAYYANLRLSMKNGGAAMSNTVVPGKAIEGIHDLILNGSDVSIDGDNITSSLAVNSFLASQIDPFIFYRAGYELHSCNIATRYLKIYDQNNSISFFFIPVVRESDGVPGLYELVNDIFIGDYRFVSIDKIEE